MKIISRIEYALLIRFDKGEVFLQQMQTKLIREYYEETGLNLLK